jgi:DNA polymerase-1
MTSTLKYQMVSSYRLLKKVIRRCKKEGATALDFETTSLTPADGRVRLVSLCNKKVSVLVDFDKIKGGFKKCAPLFEDGEWIVFNAGFELRWFMGSGVAPTCLDLANIRRAIIGGGNYGLKQIAKWDLDINMDKESQSSNWGAKVLSQKQLDYAYFDADVTWRLWRHWADQADAGHWGGFRMLNDMVPAVIEMEETGMLLDVKTHAKLIANWGVVQTERIKRVRKLVGEDEVPNINSNSQWSDYFALHLKDDFLDAWPKTEKTGQLSMKNEALALIASWVPGTPMETFFDALMDYKTISKYLSSFGQTLITKSEMVPDTRIRARFNIGAAKTCRFSSSAPNLQQTPRDRELIGKQTSVRTSFIAGLGRKLVSLDYSSIELRVLALLSGDKQLLEDVVFGDVHAEVASVIAGKKIDKTTRKGKEARQGAKGVSFGIIYGSGAGGLSTTMRCDVDTAQDYIDFWRDRYPDAFAYRFKMMDEVSSTRFIRMVDGGTIYMGKQPDLPKCANYPIQRGAAAVLFRAIVRHKDHLDEERRAGRQRMTAMLATIHDALIDEAATKDAKRLLKIMDQDMTSGYLDVFPDAPIDRLVEGGIGPSWGALE